MAKKPPTLDDLGLKYEHGSDHVQNYGIWPPVQYKPTKSENVFKPFGDIFFDVVRIRLDLLSMAKFIGLATETELIYLDAHRRRLKRYWIFQLIVYSLIYFPFIFASIGVALYVILLIIPPADASGSFAQFMLLYVAMLVVSVYLGLALSERVAAAVLDRRYADTLAFVACMNLCTLLSIDDTVSLPEDRDCMIKRSRGLRRFLTLLPYRYINNTSRSLERARQRFKKLEYYSLDVEEQLLLPNSRTQQKLRKEMLTLTKILLTSRYGQFRYGKKIPVLKVVVESMPIRILKGFSRMVGTVLPLLLFLALLVFPDRFSFLGSYNDIVALVSLAWLLLAIDTTLNLGVVDRLSTLTTAIKGWK